MAGGLRNVAAKAVKLFRQRGVSTPAGDTTVNGDALAQNAQGIGELPSDFKPACDRAPDHKKRHPSPQ